MTTEERLKRRQLTVKPLVDAYFTWAKQNLLFVVPKSNTAKGLTYSLNQEKYLKELILFLNFLFKRGLGKIKKVNGESTRGIIVIFLVLAVAVWQII